MCERNLAFFCFASPLLSFSLLFFLSSPSPFHLLSPHPSAKKRTIQNKLVFHRKMRKTKARKKKNK